MAHERFWQLRVGFSGEDSFVCGTEDVMRAAYDEITTSIRQPDGCGEKTVSVDGMAPTIDRPAVHLTVKIEDVRNVELREY